MRRRRNDFGERPEFRQQFFRQRFEITLRDGAKQYQLEQFVVRDCVAPRLPKPRAQALTMPVVMRRRLGERLGSTAIAGFVQHAGTMTSGPGTEWRRKAAVGNRFQATG